MSTLERNKPFWTEEKEQMLIELWEGRECLYDVNNRAYTCRVTRENSMKEMVEALGIPMREIIRRMSSLRTQYSRLLKPYGTANPPTKGRTGRQDWVLQSLAFLAPFVKQRPERQSSIYQFQMPDEIELEDEKADNDEGSKEENNSETAEEVLPKERWVSITPSRKRKKAAEFREEEVILTQSSRTPGLLGEHLTSLLEEDEDGLFCVYIASEMRKIKDERIKLQLKTKIQSDLMNARLESLNHVTDSENSNQVT